MYFLKFNDLNGNIWFWKLPAACLSCNVKKSKKVHFSTKKEISIFSLSQIYMHIRISIWLTEAYEVISYIWNHGFYTFLPIHSSADNTPHITELMFLNRSNILKIDDKLNIVLEWNWTHVQNLPILLVTTPCYF